ncbi:MAG: cellulose biosynthesis cyclic di-GMP-binding regulatory protein BcsB [Beijerinckiaceae bacterium]|nr:cellulose biosynthesis cyclic di-GMP-binding regulatory protein BcsB [Beijerinckiaceae bacterium]
MRIRLRAPVLTACVCASLLAWDGGAFAQSFLSSTPMAQTGAAATRAPAAPSPMTPALSSNRNAPLTPPARGAEASAATGPTSLLRPSANGSSVHSLRHLTNNIHGFRLTGEIAQAEWPMYLTDAQAQHRLSFRLGYLAAVSVMPEGSYLSLTVNDVVVGRTNIVGTRGVRTAVFDIPAGLMKPGFNAVRVTAEQRHRVDCSLEATYELWTQIDPTQTGLVLPRIDPGVTMIADLAAIPIDDQGALPIRAITPQRADMGSVERIIRAAQMISLLGRFAQPVVEFGSLAQGEHGINLAVGPIDELRAQLDGLPLPHVHGPMVVVVPASEGRRTTIVATGRTDDEVTESLQQFAVAASSKGAPEGLRAAAAFPGYRLGGGQRVRLRDLGVSSQEFSGRLFRAAFNLILPPDFYSADYGKATLDIAGGYAPGLGVGSQIIVSVNGRHVMSNKLTRAAGDVFKQNPMQLPLGSMRPGLNRIEIEAQLPVAADRSCDTLAAISGPKRFLFLDSTEIELPQIARIARMPDLAVTATGGFPYHGSENRPTLAVPNPSRESVGAAATLAAHLAIAAGRPINFRLRGAIPPAGEGPALIVAPATALDSDLLASVGLKQEDLFAAWRERIDNPATSAPEQLSRTELMARHRLVLQRNFPASCHLPTPQGGFRRAERLAGIVSAQAVGQTQAVPQVDLYDQWDTELRSSPGYFGRVLSHVENAGGWALSKVAGARDAVTGSLEGAPMGPSVTRGTPLVVAQSILGSNGNDVRTIVTAPDSVTLQQSVACLVDPRVWRQIAGRIAILNTADGQVLNMPVESSTLIATQPFSVQNVRLIVAGWMSLNNKIYVMLLLLAAGLLALTTREFIANVGRKNT